MNHPENTKEPADVLTIQYLRGKVSTLEAEKKELQEKVEEGAYVANELNLMYEKMFSSKRNNNSNANSKDSHRNVDALSAQFDKQMIEIDNLCIHVRQLQKRESELILYLSESEKQLHRYRMQMQELKDQTMSQLLRNRLQFTDAVINQNYASMQNEILRLRMKINEQDMKNISKHFNIQSNVGQCLINKCKKLTIENEEIGKELECNRNTNLKHQILLLKQQNFKLSKQIMQRN